MSRFLYRCLISLHPPALEASPKISLLAFETAPLLSRLGLIRKLGTNSLIAHEPIRAATVMERFVGAAGK